jgi:hypothetical protein
MVRGLEHVMHSGFETIWLTVWKNNERAIRFYKRWGFRKVGVYDFVVGRDVQEDFLLLRNIHSLASRPKPRPIRLSRPRGHIGAGSLSL